MSKSNTACLPVNWINGMNINQSHFIAEQKSNERALVNVLKNVVTPYSYGVQVESGVESGLFWADVNGNEELQIRFSDCEVVFPSGYCIKINSGVDLQSKHNVKIPNREADAMYVVLVLNTGKRIPFGEPDAEEVPVRKPFVMHELRVELVPVDEFAEVQQVESHLVIGLVENVDGEWRLDMQYIPPVQRVGGHPALKDQFMKFENHLSSIERSVIEIIQKIRFKKQSNELAKILFDLAQAINVFMYKSLSEYKTLGLSQAPVRVLLVFIELGRLMHNVIDTYQGCGKDELLTYFSEWCDISQGKFEGIINDLMTLKYDHNNIRIALDKVNEFADMASSMFAVLASLDFIGKKINTDLFVAEEIEEEELEGVTKRKRRFGFLGN